MKRIEGLKEENIRRTSMALPLFVKEAMEKVKAIDPKHISYISLVQFCLLHPYTLGDFMFTLHTLRLSPKKKEKLIMCFFRKDFEEVAKIIKKVLNRKRENEFKLEDVIRYMNKGEDENVAKIFLGIEDGIADLKMIMKMR